MRMAKFPCDVFFFPLKLRGPSFVNYIMYVYHSYYIHSVYVYILFFLAVERYWFRQLYHRLDFPPSLEMLSKDYTQRWFLPVAQISLKKNFQGAPRRWTALFTDTQSVWKTSLYHFRVIPARMLT